MGALPLQKGGNMNRLFILMSILVLLVGCAWTKQAITDYKTGQTTALINGEVSPAQQAAPIVSVASALPFVGPFAGILGTVLVGFFTWQRGVSIRKNNNLVPATIATSSTTLNGILQDAANIFAGMFTTASQTAPSTTGSVLQRVWKTALVTIAAGLTTAATIPSVATFLTGHPFVDAGFLAFSSGLAGIEKALSSVQPVATVTSGTTATTTVVTA